MAAAADPRRRAAEHPLAPDEAWTHVEAWLGARLAAWSIEHGLSVVSADADFARFEEVRWESPVVAA